MNIDDFGHSAGVNKILILVESSHSSKLTDSGRTRLVYVIAYPLKS